MSGFGVEKGTLEKVSGALRRATWALDEGAGKAKPAVDAGRSSTAVADAVALTVTAGVVLAHSLEGMAGNIDISDASYADVENNEEGRFRYYNTQVGPATGPGNLEDAQNRPRDLPVQGPR